MLAQRARAVGDLLVQVKQLSRDCEKNREALNDVVNTINAVLLPLAWVGLDDRGLLHVTFVRTETRRVGGTTMLQHSADVIWEFTPHTNTVKCKKCRDNRWEIDQIIECQSSVTPQAVVVL